MGTRKIKFPRRWLRPAAFAEATGLSPWWIRRLIRRGRLRLVWYRHHHLIGPPAPPPTTTDDDAETRSRAEIAPFIVEGGKVSLASSEDFEMTTPGVAPGRDHPNDSGKRGRSCWASLKQRCDLGQPPPAWRKVRCPF
jgi:hypothetical protein